MKKSFLCVLLALCLCLSLLPLTACAEFSDLEPGAYYLDAVDWAVEKGVTQGTTYTTFSPNATCTRAQIVTFLWRLFDAPKMFITNPFSDVPTTEYYYNSAVWAYDRGVSDGTDETHFSPNLPCTRAQAVTFLYRALGSPAPKLTASPFDDVQNPDAYYYNAVLWAAETGVTAGTDNTHFSPDATCTRAQIVTFLCRASHPQPMATAIYLGVQGQGTSASEGDLTAFRHRFFTDGKELTCTIAADGGAYAFQNRLQQGEAYRIRVDDGVLTLLADAAVSPTADAAGKTIWSVTTAPGGASVQRVDKAAGNRFASDEANLYCLPPSASAKPPVSGEAGVKTLKSFLQNALMPVGGALYVYGGGWNWQDTGASMLTRSVDLPESWQRFFRSQTSDYNYKAADPVASWYPWQGWNAYYYAGLDCSGYVGWAVYRTLNASSGGEGYVLSAAKMAKNYSERGLGSVSYSAENLRPGDVVSISGHVWICLGRCGDGSVVILHSTPSESRTGHKGGGVQIGALGDSRSCEACRLAEQYMAAYYPAWSVRYAPALRSFGTYTADCTVFSWGSSVLADPDGLRTKTAAEVLQLLFRDA